MDNTDIPSSQPPKWLIRCRPVMIWTLAGFLIAALFRQTSLPLMLGCAATAWWSLRYFPKVKQASAPISIKNYRITIILTISVIFFSLILIEEGARLLVSNRLPPITFSYDSEALFLPMARGKGEYILNLGNGHSKTCSYSFSSQRLRDREYSPKKKDEFRILLLGDSFTMGLGLEEDQTISRNLERILSDIPTNKHITIINGGVCGYGPWQERVLLKRYGFPLEPDLVILEFFPTNDIEDTLHKYGEYFRAYKTPFPWQHGWQMQFHDWLRKRSIAYRLLEIVTNKRLTFFNLWNSLRFLPSTARHIVPSEDRCYWWEPLLVNWYDEMNDGWAETKSDILGIRDDCQSRGIDFMVYTIPVSSSVSDERWEVECQDCCTKAQYERGKDVRISNEFFQEAGLPYVDLCAAMRTRVLRPISLYFEFDGHLCASGTRFTAQVLGEYLCEHYLVEKGILKEKFTLPPTTPSTHLPVQRSFPAQK